MFVVLLVVKSFLATLVFYVLIRIVAGVLVSSFGPVEGAVGAWERNDFWGDGDLEWDEDDEDEGGWVGWWRANAYRHRP